MARTAVFDIDGVLADLSHRLHHLTKPNREDRDYEAFYSECGEDTPIDEGRALLRSLASQGWTIVLLTGRPRSVCEQTENWLSQHHIPYQSLIMRNDQDWTTSCLYKPRKIRQHFAEGPLPDLLIDDDDAVCAAVAEMGIPTLRMRAFFE